MKTRSSTLKSSDVDNKHPQKENPNDFPFIHFNGKVHYCDNFIDCAHISERILNRAKESKTKLALGFDMEWPFNFQTDSGKTALIQVSPSLEECFLFHVFELKKLPVSLIELLSHSNVLLAGVNIKCDIHKLARDFPGIDVTPILNNCIDSRSQAKNIFVDSTSYWSMEKLVNHCFKMQINKDKTVRRSKWNIVPLSKEQKQYAAIDAYVSLKLYMHLNDLENSKIEESSLKMIS